MWFFLLTAGAQEEICEPRSPETLDVRLDGVVESLQNANLSQARSGLELAREEARCLDTVIPGPMLARMAYLHAESSIYEQDLETTWRWARLAQLADPDGGLPDHVGEDHPLNRYLPEQPDSPGIEGVDRGIAHPKKGGVFMDGKRLTRAEATAETPHLVQVFANKTLKSAFWQVGPRFDTSVLTVDDAPEVEEVLGPKKWKPAKKGTVAAWEKWIRDNPDSEWLDEARSQLDDVRFANAKADGPAGLRAYLADSPGRNARSARSALEQIDFDATEAKNTRQAWQLYLGRHPKGVFLPEALERLDTLMWTEATTADNEKGYARYLTQMRQGTHRQEARVLLAKRVFEAAQATGEIPPLRRYLSRFPQGANADRARALIRGTRFDAVAIVVRGSGEEDLATKLADVVESHGLRSEIVNQTGTFHEITRATLGNGLLWIEVEPLEEDAVRVEASLWSNRSPVREWTVSGPADSLFDIVVGRMPNLSAFSTAQAD